MTPCSRWRHTAYARRKLQSVDNHNQSVDNHNFVTTRTGDCYFGRWPPAFTPSVAPGPPLLPVCAAAPFYSLCSAASDHAKLYALAVYQRCKNLTYHRQTTAMIMTDKIDPMNIPNSNCVMLEHPLDVSAQCCKPIWSEDIPPKKKFASGAGRARRRRQRAFLTRPSKTRGRGHSHFANAGFRTAPFRLTPRIAGFFSSERDTSAP